jgi:DNA-binding NarL/FixJ family response regulator
MVAAADSGTTEDDLAVVGEADDGSAALDLVTKLSPDVVLLDVRMPTVDGIRATWHLADRVPNPLKVIAVTTLENDDYVYDGRLAGATGLLLKRARPAEIVRAIHVVVAEESLLFPVAIRLLAAQRSGGTRFGLADAGLTEREAEVLRARDRTQAVITAYESGFVTPG